MVLVVTQFDLLKGLEKLANQYSSLEYPLGPIRDHLKILNCFCQRPSSQMLN